MSASSASSVASTLSSATLYVPVHRRSSSVTRTDDSMSTTTSSRPSSRAESLVDLGGAEHTETGHGHPLVYSRDRLMSLAKSPLAMMPKEVKDGLREQLPEIVMSRKHRKSKEYHAMLQERAQTQAQSQGQARPPVQVQQANNAHNTGSKKAELEQHQHHRHQHQHQPLHANQSGRVQQPQQQKQAHIYSHTTSQPQLAGQHPAPRNSHPRPVGRAWYTAPKSAAEGMTWRRAAGPPSISVA